MSPHLPCRRIRQTRNQHDAHNKLNYLLHAGSCETSPDFLQRSTRRYIPPLYTPKRSYKTFRTDKPIISGQAGVEGVPHNKPVSRNSNILKSIVRPWSLFPLSSNMVSYQWPLWKEQPIKSAVPS
jgi:hypothetical protein